MAANHPGPSAVAVELQLGFARAEVVMHPDERRYARGPHPNDSG